MIIELFCCSGGMAEGFRRGGLPIDLAFDVSPDACESYEANLGHRPVQMDVRDLQRLVDAFGMRYEQRIDLLLADPPCTPYSRTGRRLGTDDPRDMLRTTCDLIDLLRPDRFLIGNVPGLDDHDNWLKAVQPIIGGLSSAGYCIEYARLDAANYGVPQRRVRPWWFGHRIGPCITWPEPTHGAPTNGQTSLVPLLPWVTCRQALGHLPAKDLGREVNLQRRPRAGESQVHGSRENMPARTQGASHGMDGNTLLTTRLEDTNRPPTDPDTPIRTITAAARGQLLINVKHRPSEMDEPSATVKATLTGGAQGAYALSLNDKHLPCSPDEPAPTLGAKDRGPQGACALAVRKHHRVPNGDEPARTLTAARQDDAQMMRWPWDRPATTVQRDPCLAPPGHHDRSYAIMSDDRAVILSERALTILQGFLESWVWASKTKTGRQSMRGQAMPPPFAEAVARSVRAQMERS